MKNKRPSVVGTALIVMSILSALSGCDTFFPPGDSEEYDTWYYTAEGYEGDSVETPTPSDVCVYDSVTDNADWTIERNVGTKWKSPIFRRKKGLAHLDIGFMAFIQNLHGKRHGRLELSIVVNDVVVKTVSGLGVSGGVGCTLGDPEYSSVTYKATWRTGGHVPVDDELYREGDLVTIKGNEGNLEKIGWTFAGWNTDENGGGQSWQPGDLGTMPDDNVVLYAMWTRAGSP